MSSEARYHVTQPAAAATDPLTEILDLYEDLDALLSLVLDAPPGPRKLELAFGVASKLAELTRRINTLSETRPDVITALENCTRDVPPPDL